MKIIINADDFGMQSGITDAIVEALDKGFCTQTTLMVNMPDAERAVKLARTKGFANRVGLHLNLTEGCPLTDAIRHEPSFCDATGLFKGPHAQTFMPYPPRIRTAVRAEIVAQIEKFMGFGLPMRHLDGHNHIHLCWPVLYVLAPLLRRYGFRSMRRSWWNQMRGDRSLHFRSRRDMCYFALFANYAKTKIADGFGNGRGFLSVANRLSDLQTHEVMIHPRYDADRTLIDTKDFDQNLGTPCGAVRSLVNMMSGTELVTYSDII